MSDLALGLALALPASVALNGGYLLQHVGSRRLAAIDVRRPAATARMLGRARWWLAGAVLATAGWALYVAALSWAPLSLVQAFSAGGLALAAPLAARALGEPLTGRERAAVGLVAAGLALLGVGAASPAAAPVPAAALGGVLAAVAAAAALASACARGAWRARALGLAGGALYGAADAATKAVTMDAGAHGTAAALTSPWLLAVLLLSIGAFGAFQRGLQMGPAVPVITLMTAATNAVAIVVGLAVLGDPLGASPRLATLHLAAFCLAGLGAVVLAGAQGRLAGGQQVQPPHGQGGVGSPHVRLDRPPAPGRG